MMVNDARRAGPGATGKPPSPPPAPPLPRTVSTNLRDPPSSVSQAPSRPHSELTSKRLSRRAAMAARFAAVDRANASRREIPKDEQPVTPCHMFFYGSLMDAEVLQTVTKLATPPTTRSGLVRGFRIKMWGIYPTVVPDDRGVVAGTVWHTEDPPHVLLLQEYETGAYKLCECEIELEDGHMLPGSKIFCWAGDADSPELEDGVFDFERYQKHFKPSGFSSNVSKNGGETLSGSQ